jgi:hypothetical protein
MPKLGDFIGHLLSEITIARMQADLEAVRVAELYAGHPLLRNMPVPRFRMPDVEMNVPIVVKDLEEPAAGESPQGNPPIAEMRKVFDKVLTSILVKDNLRLNAAVQKKLKITLDKRVIALTRPTEIAIDMNRVSHDFLINAMKAMGELIEPEKRAEFEETLKDSLRVEFIKIRKLPTRLNVLVTTAEIREAGPNEVITHLRLKISEEAFEWTTIESDEGKNDCLVIE